MEVGMEIEMWMEMSAEWGVKMQSEEWRIRDE